MSEQMFEIVTLLLRAVLIVVTVFIAPKLKKWIDANTTAKQREDAVFWTKLAVRMAEEIWKERGQGKFKKEYVVEWLGKNGVKISASQMDTLIEMVVTEYNRNGWGAIVTEPESK